MAPKDILKRLRTLFEKVAFAGLKPTVPGASAPKKPPTRLHALFDRLLSGSTESDPLYLTNRTLAQKLKVWLVIGIPAALLIAGLAVVMLGLVHTPAPPPSPEATPAQIAQKLLPDLNKNLDIPTDRTLEISEVHIEHNGSTKMVGTVRNTTSTPVAGADMVFDLTDLIGSRMGAVSAHVGNVPANGSVQFAVPIAQEKAAFAIVREVHRL